jgi:hypothetical protein
MLRQVDHDAGARCARQKPLLRHDDDRARARQPRVDARIRVGDFLVTEAVLARDVEQRVLQLGLRRDRGADHVAALRRQRVLVSDRRQRGCKRNYRENGPHTCMDHPARCGFPHQ